MAEDMEKELNRETDSTAEGKDNESVKSKKNKKDNHSNAKIKELEERIETLEDEKEQFKNEYLRKSAEFENYKKRMRKEMDDFRVLANKDLVEKMIPILNNYDRAIKTSGESKNFEAIYEGLKIINSELHSMLEEFNVHPIEAEGKEFDPNLHEALMMEERDDVEFDNTVVQEFEKGYIMGDYIIKHSKVKVGKKINKD